MMVFSSVQVAYLSITQRQIKLTISTSHSILTPVQTRPITNPTTPGAYQGSRYITSFNSFLTVTRTFSAVIGNLFYFFGFI